jgi:hypothetical protein
MYYVLALRLFAAKDVTLWEMVVVISPRDS